MYYDGSTCQSTLSWSAWETPEDSPSTNKSDPTQMPTIEIEHDGMPMGIIDTSKTIEQNGNKTILGPDVGQTLHFLLNSFNLENGVEGNYFGVNTGVYTLPDRDGDYYLWLYKPYKNQPDYPYINSQARLRNVTFKLMGNYNKVFYGLSAGSMPEMTEGNRCSLLGGSWIAPNSGTTYYCSYKKLLAETTVNAVCRSGSTWSDNTNSCLPDCVLGYSYSGNPYQSSNDPETSYRCRPTTTPTVVLNLTKSSNGQNILLKDVNGEIMTDELLTAGTYVKVGFEENGLYKNDTTCKLYIDGTEQDSWPKGVTLVNQYTTSTMMKEVHPDKIKI